MKKITIISAIVMLTAILSFSPKKECKFYDGEGNEIPVEAVSVLVRSQFVNLRLDEQILLEDYFPITTYSDYVDSLEEIGYSSAWAYHKAAVELNHIPADELYNAIITD